MRSVLYSPYLGSTYGGGEKYLGSTAEVVRDRFGGEVELLAPVPVDVARYEAMLGLDLSGIGVAAANPSGGGWRRRLARLPVLRPLRDRAVSMQARRRAGHPDVFFNMVYGLPAFTAGRRNVLLVQFPTARHPAGGYDRVICQSEYVRQWTRRLWDIDAVVVNPPVEVPAEDPSWERKDRIILTVGRFVVGGHEKRHDLLVESFRRLVAEGLEGWQLHVAGSVQDDPDDLAYLERVRALAEGAPVTFHVGCGSDELRDLYDRASIYWHAAGYGVDPSRRPADLEHFGMTTAEAMAHGAVPVAIAAGGQPEVVEDAVSGFLWRDPDSLRARTLELVADASLRRRMGEAARRRSERFSRAAFASRMAEALAPVYGGADA